MAFFLFLNSVFRLYIHITVRLSLLFPVLEREEIVFWREKWRKPSTDREFCFSISPLPLLRPRMNLLYPWVQFYANFLIFWFFIFLFDLLVEILCDLGVLWWSDKLCCSWDLVNLDVGWLFFFLFSFDFQCVRMRSFWFGISCVPDFANSFQLWFCLPV